MTTFSERSVTHRVGQAVAGIALLAFLLSGWPAVGVAEPDTEVYEPFKVPKTGMKDGRLTGRHENSAEISGRDYAFHPKIEFGDDEGKRLPWRDFKKGDMVQFHLKQEKIDYLILVPPK